MPNKSVSATHEEAADRYQEQRSAPALPTECTQQPRVAVGRMLPGLHRTTTLFRAAQTPAPSTKPTPPPAKRNRGLIRPLGFQHTCNGILFLVFAGAMLAFTLARFPYVNVAGDAASSFKNAAVPGEWHAYREGRWRAGIAIHLRAVLPCGFLMVWQFVPRVRRQLPALHRVNGYAVMVLAVVANVGALMVCRRSFGGGLEVQSAVVALAVASTGAIAVAYYSIMRRRVDRHRVWMLRAAFYLGTVVTTRAIMAGSAVGISKMGGYYQVQSCEKIAFINGDGVDAITGRYPGCAGLGAGQEGSVAVPANLRSGFDEQRAAALGLSFGMALWVSLFLHAVGVEMYLALTAEKGDRGEYQLRGEIENWT